MYRREVSNGADYMVYGCVATCAVASRVATAARAPIILHVRWCTGVLPNPLLMDQISDAVCTSGRDTITTRSRQDYNTITTRSESPPLNFMIATS